MQRIAVYLFSALALVAALWLVLPSSSPEEPADLAAAGSDTSAQKSRAGRDPALVRVPAGTVYSGLGPRAGAVSAGGGSESDTATQGGAAEGQAADGSGAQPAQPGFESGTGGTTAGTATTGPRTSDTVALLPLPIAGEVPAAATPDPPRADPTPEAPSDTPEDPTPLPPGSGEETAGDGSPRLTPREIWERVEEECPDCPPAVKEELYEDIDTKSGIAAGLTFQEVR